MLSDNALIFGVMMRGVYAVWTHTLCAAPSLQIMPFALILANNSASARKSSMMALGNFCR